MLCTSSLLLTVSLVFCGPTSTMMPTVLHTASRLTLERLSRGHQATMSKSQRAGLGSSLPVARSAPASALATIPATDFCNAMPNMPHHRCCTCGTSSQSGVQATGTLPRKLWHQLHALLPPTSVHFAAKARESPKTCRQHLCVDDVVVSLCFV